MKFNFNFPDVGEGIHEGTIVKWLVEEGQEISEGDSIVEVETDKVTTDIPSPKDGTVLELLGGEGDILHVGNPFVVLDIEGEGPGDPDISAAGGGTGDAGDEADKEQELEEKEEEVEEETAGVVGEVEVSSKEIPPSDEVTSSKKSREEKRKKALATPVARAMAKDLGVDINTVEGTGPAGRVMKADIQKAKDTGKTKAQRAPKQGQEAREAVQATREPKALHLDEAGEDDGRYERVPLTRIRQTISQRMSESRFTIPHTTVMDEINVTELDKFRKKYKDTLREEGVNLTYLPFIIKASIRALKELREFNASLDEVNDEMVYKNFYNIGMATDTERGLMVPVIKDADKKSIVEIAREIADLGERAKDNKLELSELQGGTFTVTNYGSIGGHFGIPIINHPEAAILGLGRIVKKPIVENDEIVIGKVLPVSLSYDHRIIDGASGSRFIVILRELLMDPEMLFLKS